MIKGVYHPSRRRAAEWYKSGKNTSLVDTLLALRVYQKYIRRQYGLDLRAIAELTGTDSLTYLSRRVGYWCFYNLVIQAGVTLTGSKTYVLGQHGYDYLVRYVPSAYKVVALDAVIANAKACAQWLRINTQPDKECVYKKQPGGALAWKLLHVVRPLIIGDEAMDTEALGEASVD